MWTSSGFVTICHKRSQVLCKLYHPDKALGCPWLPLLYLQLLTVTLDDRGCHVTQAASDRATRAARERVMARIFWLSVSEDVYWFVAGGSAKPCKAVLYRAVPSNVLRVATDY